MSDHVRFFVSTETIVSDHVDIAGDTYHHLCNVLRVKPGQIIYLLDGKGRGCKVEITGTGRDNARGCVLSRWQAKDTSLPITLIQSLPKGDKFDLVLQKGTELGISCFQPIVTEHTVPQLSSARIKSREQRWQRIASEAARQSRRDFLPDIQPLRKLEDIMGSSADLKLVLWEAGAVPFAEALPEQPPESVQLIVGPEGGFTDTEIGSIVSAGFTAVHLGPRILRTETAGLAATPVLQYLYGDWQKPPANDNSIQGEEKP